MDKETFLARLRVGFTGLPQDDMEERLNFYREMIDDRIEEGLSEEEAVLAVGSVEEIIGQVTGDAPPAKAVTRKDSGRRSLKTWEIVLLAAGSPVWGSLLIAAFAVIFSLWVSLWSVIVSLWAVFASVAASAAGVVIGGIVMICCGNRFPGIAAIGAGIICAGLSIFLLHGCKAATQGAVRLTGKILQFAKGCFTKKEEA